LVVEPGRGGRPDDGAASLAALPPRPLDGPIQVIGNAHRHLGRSLRHPIPLSRTRYVRQYDIVLPPSYSLGYWRRCGLRYWVTLRARRGTREPALPACPLYVERWRPGKRSMAKHIGRSTSEGERSPRRVPYGMGATISWGLPAEKVLDVLHRGEQASRMTSGVDRHCGASRPRWAGRGPGRLTRALLVEHVEPGPHDPPPPPTPPAAPPVHERAPPVFTRIAVGFITASSFLPMKRVSGSVAHAG